MEKICIFAGSFDPLTFGHIDIIKRSLNLSDKLVIAVGLNENKNYTFSIDERKNMIHYYIDKAGLNDRVEVETISHGMLVDFAFGKNAFAIVKGIRDEKDFDYEKTLHEVGSTQDLFVETILLFTNKNLSHVSSSATKAVTKNGGFIHDYVPLNVKYELERKILNRKIIGITGEICSGKSYISEKLSEYLNNQNIPCYNLDLDKIVHEIYEDNKNPMCLKVKDEIKKVFGISSFFENGSINRKYLGNIVFNDLNMLSILNNLLKETINIKLRQKLHNKEGIILLNSALLAESDMLKLCNNNVILVSTHKSIQYNRLIDRCIDNDQIYSRIKSQYSNLKKKNCIIQSINENFFGSFTEIINDERDTEKLLKDCSNFIFQLDNYKER